MNPGEEKYRILEPEQTGGETVVMIHGLFVGAYVWWYQARFFHSAGYRVVLYDYPTVRRTVRQHGERLAAFLNSGVFDSGGKIHFITHSMGGLLLRSAVEKLAEERFPRLGRAVMIAPPNRGSDRAALVLKLIPGAARLIAPIHDLSSGSDSFANLCPVSGRGPAIGIIAASRDRQVRPEQTRLGGESDYLLLPGSHTGILFRKETAEQAGHFLRFGKFRRPSAPVRPARSSEKTGAMTLIRPRQSK